MNLEKELQNYRNTTLKLIDTVGNAEEIQGLIQERQQIIDTINSMNYAKEEFKSLASDLNLLELEQILISKIKKEKVNARNTLDNVRKLKQARTMYNTIESRPVFFNSKSY